MENEGDSDSDAISYCSEDEKDFKATLQGIRDNDPNTDRLEEYGGSDYIDNFTDEEWEELGRDISNNTHLTYVNLSRGALNDHKMSCFFRGLTRSNSIEEMSLCRNNELSAVGIRSMMPFLQNAYNLIVLDLSGNNIQSEGFNTLLRALQNSPVERLWCEGCGIESIEINSEQKPKHLKKLWSHNNIINADGCRGLAKLLQGEDSTLTHLHLDKNKIDDEGVTILVDALRTNTTLECLYLRGNSKISKQGKIMLLKLLNDVSSIKAALQSNHILRDLFLDPLPLYADEEVQMHIDMELAINKMMTAFVAGSPGAPGRTKVIRTLLHSGRRTRFANLQGVDHSLYSEINPLHLPEVFALVGRCHGQGELYVAMKSSVAGVISTVNRKQCLLQQRAYHSSKIDAIDAEIAAIEDGEGLVEDIRGDFRSSSSSKRRRV